jgi:hypothetical protein
MDPRLFEHPELLILFLIFFVPGLVMLKVWDQIVPQGARRDLGKSLFEAIAYSGMNLGFFMPLIVEMRAGRLGPVSYFLSLFLILLGAPAAWPFLLRTVLSSRWLARRGLHPIEQPWDFVFGQHEPFWIVVHLRDLGRIGGRFAGNSFAFSSPSEPQIYLEEVWTVDNSGRLIKPVQQSRGIVILNKDILAVEFFSYYEGREVSDGGQEETGGCGGL